MARGGLLVGVMGISLLFHAAYQTILYRGVLKIREEEFLWPPPQVLLEIMISLALCFLAALRVPGRFLPILPSTEGNRLLHTPENLDFITFNHRGKVFPLKLESKLKR